MPNLPQDKPCDDDTFRMQASFDFQRCAIVQHVHVVVLLEIGMKKFVFIFALMLARIANASASADEGRQLVGTWPVTNNDDRFGKGGTFVAAAFDETMGTALVVRCIEKDLSLAILEAANDPNPLTLGVTYVVKLRTDKEPIMTSVGKAISERLIQVDTQADMV
jgi:hypothetical protein